MNCQTVLFPFVSKLIFAKTIRPMKFFLVLFSAILLFSCNEDDTPRDAYLPEANGQHGEILILMDNNLWDGSVGEAVIENLTQRAKGPYLRPEPMFTYFRKEPQDLNHLNKLNRNILKFMIDTDSSYQKTAVFEERNYYAKNQLFLIVKDSDPGRLLAYAKNEMNEVIDQFNSFEKQQLIRIYKKEPNNGIKEISENKFGLSISLPKRSVLKTDKKDFLMVKHDRSKNLLPNDATKSRGGTFWVQQGFLFWSEPYQAETNQLSIDNVLQKRDSVLKYNVAGRVAGTYMATEYDPYYKPEGRIFEYEGHQAVEIRGLWKNDGEIFTGGGGPFVQYTILNEARNQVVTVCGYVYAPKFDKREYIRELDAILNTINVLN